MTEHTVRAYDQELGELAQLVAQMGEGVRQQLHDAIGALTRHDGDLAARVIANDQSVDGLEKRVEQMAIQLIAKRAPMAVDLRDIMAALRISIDFERIGDCAKNIARRFAALDGDVDLSHLLRRLEQMAGLAVVQIKDVVDSFVRRDVAEAMKVWRRDEEIDAMYTSLFRELLTYMMEAPRNITVSTHLLFCAKYIERVGDHATNIAETVHFMINGEPPKGDRPRGDLSSVAMP